MKIAIQPVKQLVPGRGLLLATLLNVEVQRYELGGTIRGSYDLIALLPAPETKPDQEPQKPKELVCVNGHAELTPDQADAWGKDDTYFCRCIAENAGLTPA